ncbi:hypothetical protein HCH_05829 [Hahella chejuensis KCTC 2396]|uniref:CheW-like domain-containing protein n=1 Tax=Hahella chejuensis (strain KCTC 2396) TaxID=349521 RepID=Q2SA45_HAHCH|nr:chemotaxis protein CheW [Hahella chejuensis]ABC32479.1 hypothetical protein HCH_05829 [Hahella chejuensis KCTC 2396]
MNSVSIPVESKRILRPSEAFALLRQINAETREEVRENQATAWFALRLAVKEVDAETADQGNLGLLIREDCYKELLESPEICPVPYAPKWLSGFVNVRSQVTPVVDLEIFFGLREDAEAIAQQRKVVQRTSPSYLLYFDQGQESFAIKVRRFPNKLMMTADERMTQPPPLSNALMACVNAVYRQNGIWCEWNLETFKRRLTDMLSTS